MFKRVLAFVFAILCVSLFVAGSVEGEASVSTEANVEVDRADRGFMSSLELHCRAYDLGDCEDGVGVFHFPYTLVHYLVWG